MRKTSPPFPPLLKERGRKSRLIDLFPLPLSGRRGEEGRPKARVMR